MAFGLRTMKKKVKQRDLFNEIKELNIELANCNARCGTYIIKNHNLKTRLETIRKTFEILEKI